MVKTNHLNKNVLQTDMKTLISFCGFNGFQQFKTLNSNNDKHISQDDIIKNFNCGELDYEPSIVSASWSNILIGNNKKLTLSGFINGKPAQTILLDMPFKESVIQATCGKMIIVVTTIGQVWQYNIDEGEWKNLTNLFSAEISDKEPGRIVKVCTSETLNIALSSAGLVYCIPNLLSYNGVIKDVACGKEHGVVLTEGGSVLTWGGGSRGQLGTGELDSSETLCEVEALSGLRVVAVSAGGWHTAVVTDEGDLYTWGWNKQGQLGFPTPDDEKESGVTLLAIPTPIELPENIFVEQVSCGASHTVIKLRDGDVLGCGWNKWGQLGLEGVKRCSEMTKLMIPPEASVQQVVCGPWNTLLLCK